MLYFVSYILQLQEGMFVLGKERIQDIWLVEDIILLDSEHEDMVDIHLLVFDTWNNPKSLDFVLESMI
jgi:hypothetical protein